MRPQHNRRYSYSSKPDGKVQSPQESVHLAFIDLEKALNHIPRELIWQALQTQLVPEYYIKIFKEIYHKIKTGAHSSAGVDPKFPIKIRIPQGSTLNPMC